MTYTIHVTSRTASYLLVFTPVAWQACYNRHILGNEKKIVKTKYDAVFKPNAGRAPGAGPAAGAGAGPNGEQKDGHDMTLVYGTTGEQMVDLTFPRHENLKFLPRYIFGLLKCPILSGEHTSHPDVRTYLQCLYR